MKTYQIGTIKIAKIPSDGTLLSSEQNALDIIGQTFGGEIDLVAIPISRMTPDFFTLSNKLAGLFIQKMTNYRLRIAFVGDISAQIAASDALRDFVQECGRSGQVLFVADTDGLAKQM